MIMAIMAIMAIKAGKWIGQVPSLLANHQASLVRCFEPPKERGITTWLVIRPQACRPP